ncbi:MAG: hypothetical protein Q4B99_02470 [Clostridia bacterium]|nr:hypothetical protein [Clostridia bacterium]
MPKKAITIVLAITLMFAAFGCTPQPDAGSSDNLEGTLPEILNKIYESAELDADTKSWLAGMSNAEVPDDNKEWFFGTSDIEYAEAFASEPMISSQPYSLVLVRANEGQDIEALKATIRNNVDPVKWLCVFVDESDVVVDNIGDVVILIMSSDSAALHEAFLSLNAE